MTDANTALIDAHIDPMDDWCGDCERYAAENERVLKLLTEFVGMADALEAALARTEANRDAMRAALQQVLHHCRNTGRGSDMVDARIVERCEDTAAAALAALP